MPLSQIRITALRCLSQVELRLHAGRNYFFGANGAGKTSLLEAVYLLGRGRSFRTRQIRKLVQNGASSFAVYGEVQHSDRTRRLGVAFEQDSLQKKIDGDSTIGMAALALALPVHVIDPGVHQLIEGGPSERRRFLDWGVFHVEPDYLPAWRQYRRVLGQRNAALKIGAGAELRSWTVALAELGETIHVLRQKYMEELRPATETAGRQLLEAAVQTDYRRGWPIDRSLLDALREAEPADRLAGSTHVGPHRADLAIHLDARGVRDEASRGQQKLVATTLVLAQAQVHGAASQSPGVMLVDDPAAELDREALERLLTALDGLPSQLLLTGLSPTQLPPRPGFPVFHVERGKVQLV